MPARARTPVTRTLHTGTDLLTDRQARRLKVLFEADQHVEVYAN